MFKGDERCFLSESLSDGLQNMGSLGASSSSNTSQSGTQSGQTTYNPDTSSMNFWNALMGAATGEVAGQSGLGGLLNTANYPTAASMVAPMTDVMGNYLGNANAISGVSPLAMVGGPQGNIQALSGDMYNTQAGMSPFDIQMPGYGQYSFQPNQGTLNGIAAWGNTQFGNIPQVQGNWNIPYQNVNAPSNPVSMLSGLPQVRAPNLNYYQMNPVQQIGPQQSWTAPGVSEQFMSPYTQNVVDAQLAQAQVQEQQQLQQQNAAATQAGAFGGSRAAVEAANTGIGYQQLASQLEAQGLQNAYTQGAQQFNTQQALGMQGLLANQATALQTGTQNLAANLQTQGLGAQTNMQSQLANQTTALQSGISNQQAQEFGAAQQMQASLANQQAGIQTGIQGAQLGMQGQMANQAASMQAKGLQYQGGVQAAEAQQALELQGALAGGQLGLQSAQTQAALRQAQQGLNMQAIQNTAGLQQNAAGLNLAGYGSYLQGLGALGQAGGAAQGLAQMTPDAQLSSWLMQQQLPIQGLAALATLMSMRPLPYTMGQAGQYSGTGQTQTSSSPGLMGILGGVGSLLGGFGLAKGGRAPSGTGLARYRSKGTFDGGRYQTGGVIDSPPSAATPASSPSASRSNSGWGLMGAQITPPGTAPGGGSWSDWHDQMQSAWDQLSKGSSPWSSPSLQPWLQQAPSLPWFKQTQQTPWFQGMVSSGAFPASWAEPSTVTQQGSQAAPATPAGIGQAATGLGQTSTKARGGLASKGERARLRSARNLNGRNGWM